MGLRPTKVHKDAQWGGPPGPRGSPWTRSLALDHMPIRPTWASAADQGSAPLGVFNGVGAFSAPPTLGSGSAILGVAQRRDCRLRQENSHPASSKSLRVSRHNIIAPGELRGRGRDGVLEIG
jgi:hypothetical protein